jgi:hypothetical protein
MVLWKDKNLAVNDFAYSSINEYIEIISASETAYNDIKALYMPEQYRKYVTGLSSGVLPKWDFGTIFIKASGEGRYGEEDFSAINESYIYKTFNGLGINIANAYPIVAVFSENNSTKVRTAMVSSKFKGNLEYYRDIRNNIEVLNKDQLFKNSQIYDFITQYKTCANDFIQMCVLDILTHQEDRHTKNFGIINAVLSPIYDNGASLGYDRDNIGNPQDTYFKAFGKKYEEVINEAAEIEEFNIQIDKKTLIKNMNESKKYFSGILTADRLFMIEKYVIEAIDYINGIGGVSIQ